MIVVEPDRGTGFVNFAPRVMINEADLPASRLIQPASRVGYRFAVAGPDAQVARFLKWALEEVKKPTIRGVRVESLEGGRPEMKQTLDRAEKFLNLVALLAALLSAVAVALAARGFAAAHLDDCAMLRVLGQSQRTIAMSYTFEFALIGIAASALGVLIGYAVHFVFIVLLAGLVEAALPGASLWPVAFGVGMGLTLLFAFGLPPVLQLAQVPPLRVIRRDVGNLKPASAAVLAVGVTGFAALLLAASSDLLLGGIAVGGFAGAVVVFAGLSWLAVKVLRACRQRGHRAALDGDGHAPDLGPAGLCRGAGQRAGGGPAGAGAAGAAAHRPDRQLAQGDAAGCAQPLRDQRHARAGRGVPESPARCRGRSASTGTR